MLYLNGDDQYANGVSQIGQFDEDAQLLLEDCTPEHIDNQVDEQVSQPQNEVIDEQINQLYCLEAEAAEHCLLDELSSTDFSKEV